MFRRYKTMLALVAALAGGCAGLLGATPVQAAGERPIYVSVGDASRPPIGWVEFCNENPGECATKPTPPRDVVLSAKAWKDLVRVNKWVNDTIKPVTDLDHWGVAERWSYPDDGKGDCEDYVLLKRRMLMAAGVPRQVLLITVVRDNRGEGHAVLTVATDKGDLILDNKRSQILPWTETGYAFLKRQSREHPNRWEGIGGSTATATASR